MARMSITFDGFDKLAEELNKKEVALKPAVNEALEESQKYIQQRLESAAEPYRSPNTGLKGYAKGDLYEAIIKEPHVEWENSYFASVKVGFSSENRKGFMHSIFVMYGVPFHGKFNHGYKKDAKIYNAIKGTRTRNQIEKIQKKTLERYLKFGR